jgi:hypothetical protein
MVTKAKRRNLLDRAKLMASIAEGDWECEGVYGEWRAVRVEGDARIDSESVVLRPSDFAGRGKYGFAQIHDDASITLSVSDTRTFKVRDIKRKRFFDFEVLTTNRLLNGNEDTFIASSLEQAEAMAAEHYRRVFVGTGHTVSWRLKGERPFSYREAAA